MNSLTLELYIKKHEPYFIYRLKLHTHLLQRYVGDIFTVLSTLKYNLINLI
jgi:hypothetical protein